MRRCCGGSRAIALLLVPWPLLLDCSASPPPPSDANGSTAPSTALTVAIAAPTVAIAAPPAHSADAAPPDPAADAAPPATRGPGCATVDFFVDLRALPTNTSPEHMDLFVRGEASDFAALASGGPPPAMFTNGGSSLEARFDGASDRDAVARCQRTVAAYLPTAPRLAGSMASAANVTRPCRPCARGTTP
jgi:hypothetical protein